MNRAFNGKMNTDADPYRLPASDYSYAMNITRDAQGEGQDLVVSNVVGNTVIPYILPSVNSKVIGSRPDSIRNRIYYFIWNAEDNDLIMYYDATSGQIVKLLQNLTDTDDIDVLQFNPSYRINHIDIIYRDDDGDLLYWTDGLNRPRVLNVQDAIDDIYGTSWKAEYLTVARVMPNLAPTSSYQNDATVTVNNLRKTLYQFRYRWVYRDDTKSTWSPYSKLLAPANPDDIVTNLDGTKNNRIDVVANTGDADVVKVEVAAREIIGANVFSDDYTIATLDKSVLGILSNTQYTYQFFNDSAYAYVDQRESQLLFDYVPKKAYAQALPNGNVLTYGAITEGINFDFSLDAVATPSMIAYTEVGNLQANNDFVGTSTYAFTLSGQPTEGDLVVVNLYYIELGTEYYWPTSYTVQLGDTLSDVKNAIISQIDALDSGNSFDAYLYGDQIYVSLVASLNDRVFDSQTQTTITLAADVGSVDEVSNSIYKHKSKYRFGIVYFDEYGVTDGAYLSNSMVVTTGELTTTGGTASDIPTIEMAVYHQPPINATNFSFVRSLNQTVAAFKGFVAADCILDPAGPTPAPEYQYLNISNLQNNTDNFPAYEFVKGDRVRIIGAFSAGAAGTVLNSGAGYDYPIVDLVTNPTPISATIPNGVYLKIPYDSSAALTATTKYFIEIYTPAVNTDTGAQLFYEFGETYPILNAGTANRVHKGSRQDQVGTTKSSLGTPAAPTVAVAASAGNLGIGAYYYRVAYGDANGNFGRPSDASLVATTTGGNQQVNLSAIPVSSNTSVTQRRIYRTKVGGTEYYLLATISDNTTTTYTDNIADTALVTIMIQPAIYNFTRGDVYYRTRKFPINATLTTVNTVYFADQSVSDFYSSQVNGNGRPFTEHSDAEKEIYYPTLVRFGGEFQQNTNINDTNRFYFDSQDTYDRSVGDIRKFHVEGRTLYVWHKFDVGVVPIYTQVVRDTTGNPLEANSDILLNKIQYPYKGKFGIGDCAASFAYYKQAKYWVDPTKGVVCRLSQDGITPLSTVYGMNAFFSSKLKNFRKDLNNGVVPTGQTYFGDPTVIGVFDYYTNKYILALEQIIRYETPTSDPYFTQGLYTVVYWESDYDQLKGFETFLSLYPESMACLDNQLYSFSLGQIAIHNNTEDYNRFFGIRGDIAIEAVFNDNALQKKTPVSIAEMGSVVWPCTSIRTNTAQNSKIPEASFKTLEGMYHAPFFRAQNTTGGLANGQVLKGNYFIVKFERKQETGFCTLNMASLKYNNSSLTSV